MQVFRWSLSCYACRRRARVDRETDKTERDSVALDVGDGTFAVFLHGDVHVGGGHVALLSALLPHSGPAVAFVLLDDVQHLAQSEWAMLSRTPASLQPGFPHVLENLESD